MFRKSLDLRAPYYKPLHVIKVVSVSKRNKVNFTNPPHIGPVQITQRFTKIGFHYNFGKLLLEIQYVLK